MNAEEPVVRLSPKAVEKIQGMQGQGKGFFTLGITKGGCSGFMYEISLKPERGEEDHLVEQDAVQILVQKSALEFQKGSAIDYKESLQDAGFKIENPNVTKTCGCGHSVG